MESTLDQLIAEEKVKLHYFDAMLEASSKYLTENENAAFGDALGMHFDLKTRVSSLKQSIYVWEQSKNV
jgi:hypothetical protein